MQTTKQSRLLLTIIGLMAIGAGGAAAALASAAANTSTDSVPQRFMGMMGRGQMGLGIHGTVASISGSTMTVTGEDGQTYTVDLSSANISKFAEDRAPVTASVAEIAVGDEVGVHGTISGTNVTATEVMDGIPPRGQHGMMGGGRHGRGPGVVGTVSAISGDSITLAAKDGTTYTVDAKDAKVTKTVSIGVTDIAVGDTIGVAGEVSGTTVTANRIMDGLPLGLDTKTN